MNKPTATASTPASGRGSVARLPEARRSSSTSTRNRVAVSRARDARRQLGSRQDRFAHLKRMYD
jgi:hypothetical protein